MDALLDSKGLDQENFLKKCEVDMQHILKFSLEGPAENKMVSISDSR